MGILIVLSTAKFSFHKLKNDIKEKLEIQVYKDIKLNGADPNNTEIGLLASTTGNINGIFDMSGGTWETTMGVVSDSEGNPLSGRNQNYNSGFTGNLSIPEEIANGQTSIIGKPFPVSRYYDLYKYISNDNKSYNNKDFSNRILGDATGELGPFGLYNSTTVGNRPVSSWYNGESYMAFSGYPWMGRG